MSTTLLARETALTAPCFRLKGGLFTLTALQLLANDYSQLEADLAAKVKQAPQFFNHTPIIIDMQLLPQVTAPIDFAGLNNLLRRYHLIPIGVKGGSPAQQQAAIQAGFAVFHDTKTEKASAEPEKPAVGFPTKVITQPVRSGQQIYAAGGDLIVLAPVSVGAELLADGHIHVYGVLRGRALAGIHGDTSAHIFCQRLEAELVSVAGQYRLSEQLKSGLWQEAVDIKLCQGELQITKL